MAIAHYLNMLDKQREVVIPHVILAVKPTSSLCCWWYAMRYFHGRNECSC